MNGENEKKKRGLIFIRGRFMAIIYVPSRGNGKCLATVKKLAELNEPVIVSSERYKEIIEKEAREFGIDIPEMVLKSEDIKERIDIYDRIRK